jgi:hypothetical protein
MPDSDDPGEKGYPGPPRWGRVWGYLSHPVKKILLQNLKKRGQGPPKAVEPMIMIINVQIRTILNYANIKIKKIYLYL